MSDSIARREPDLPAAQAAPFSRYLSITGVSLLFSVIGIAIAAYLTFTHYQEKALICNVGSCKTVQESKYAMIGAVPIAALGLGMFIVLAILAISRLTNWSIVSSEMANIIAWGITLTGLMYYAYLTYVEISILDAICQWCVGTALATLAIFLAELVGLFRSFAIIDDSAIE